MKRLFLIFTFSVLFLSSFFLYMTTYYPNYFNQYDKDLYLLTMKKIQK